MGVFDAMQTRALGGAGGLLEERNLKNVNGPGQTRGAPGRCEMDQIQALIPVCVEDARIASRKSGPHLPQIDPFCQIKALQVRGSMLVAASQVSERSRWV